MSYISMEVGCSTMDERNSHQRGGAGWLRRVADVLRSSGTVGIQASGRRTRPAASQPAQVAEVPEPVVRFRPRGRTAEATMEDTRILLVEDEPSISGFVRRGLIFEGYEVEVVDDGRRALEVLFDTPPIF